MKNKIIMGLCFFVLAACQTSTKNATPVGAQVEYQKFNIRKLTEVGVIEVSVAPQKNSAWPSVTEKKVDGLTVNSQTFSMAVIGDTGCRLKEKKSGDPNYQECQKPEEWRYPDLVKQLLREKMDLVVHTGDYHYREQCSNPTACAVITKSIGFGWNAWWDDFYGPTQELFKKNTFLFVRGNHEACDRAYQGWKPLSNQSLVMNEACVGTEPFEINQIGDLILINFDNSSFEERGDMPAEARLAWVQQFRDLSIRLGADLKHKEVWLLFHKPALGFNPRKEDAEPESISDRLLGVISETDLLTKIDYILSGHIHNQQIVLTKPKFKQFIVGNSGTSLEPFGRVIRSAQLISSTESKKNIGYALFNRDGFKKWHIVYKDVEGNPNLSCSLNKQKISCD